MMLFGSVLRWHVTRPAYAHKEGLMSGKYFDDLIPGTHYHHPLAHTITETENSLFCNLTRNTQPLHLDPEFAKRTHYGQRIVNGLFTLSLVVGLSVPDLTEGTLIANLGYDKIVHPNPVFLNDTLFQRIKSLYDRRESLGLGESVQGLAVIEEPTATTLVPPGWRAEVARTGALELSKDEGA